MRRCLIVCLLLAACGLKEPEDERVRKSIASWEASLALTANSFARGELPKHFLKNAAEAATDELSKEKVPPKLTHAAARALALADQLKNAAEHDDPSAATRAGNALDKEAKELQQ
jgi:hypothetical protein